MTRLLEKEHKEKHFESAFKFLQCYQKEVNAFLNRIVTGDGTWIQHISPEMKCSSLDSKHSTPLTRTVLSAGKMIIKLFFVREGLVPKCAMNNASSYCETLK